MNPKSLFVCQSCGNEFPKWAGKCSACGQWNTLVETPVSTKKSAFGRKNHESRALIPLNSLNTQTSGNLRITTGINEFNRVLGGGLVPGQVVLLAGEPGIGKSTLLLQVASLVGLDDRRLKVEDGGRSSKMENRKNQSSTVNPQSTTFYPPSSTVLYVCGEESPSQIKIRASRLGVSGGNISLLTETDVDSLLGTLGSDPKGSDPILLIVDSIQTLTTDDLASAQGSVAQVKECTARILNFVKDRGIPTILIGHVNKEGDIAGPKVLEHMVDTVLYLEGERFGSLRLLRAIKNRFGDVGEVGVFQMEERGFVEVKNPSAAFIQERAAGAGSVVTVTMEGTRPVLLEVQALASKSSFNYPRRSASGFDLNRLYFICAVLEKHLKIPLQGNDLYVNVTAGAKISEPAGDLAVAVAIVSSFRDRKLNQKTAVFGEVGLSAEVRSVTSQKRREQEAGKLGFTNVVGPAQVKNLAEAVRQAL